MLDFDDIKVEFESQGFRCNHVGISPERDKAVMFMESIANTESVICPFCQQSTRMVENVHVTLRDMMLWPDVEQKAFVSLHRYQCRGCAKTFTEHIPFKYPGTRITYRAANWIKGFLQQKVSIKAIQELTGIHWDTIRKVQREIMDAAIWEREDELKKAGYKPRILAVDEFAIHKGHSYATCVMDLETGDVLWVGKGRAIKDFEKFFEDMPSGALSAVIAVAMDMNASYNKLVTQHLPNAQIVYDRFHMQSQFGRDVLGVVRLDEARKHKAKSKEILAVITNDTDKDTKQAIKEAANAEKREYSKLKKLRWTLLTNGGNLSEDRSEHLQSILQDHHDLAVCYAMKEEMCRLYELTDHQQAFDGWTKWFEAAKESGIPALVKFAIQKECRISGLAAHAIFQISTGKLEGFNNKIKVAKRIGYGYRDEDYFFTLIRYLSLPHSLLHGNP
ncbi:MAG: ISL3 family transposase [Clostridia bacterium]|nr:ISL3 family transposase [Clostridia bacterium]